MWPDVRICQRHLCMEGWDVLDGCFGDPVVVVETSHFYVKKNVLLTSITHQSFMLSSKCFFFLTCSHKKEEEIRTSDLRFMRHGPQIKLPLKDNFKVFWLFFIASLIIKIYWLRNFYIMCLILVWSTIINVYLMLKYWLNDIFCLSLSF
jgi:hypothetical protein